MHSPRMTHSPWGVPLQPRPIGSAVPLGAMQLEFWNFITEHGGRFQRTVWTVRRIVGPLQVDLLKESLDFLVSRHEPLRTRIIVSAGVPMQLIEPDRPCAFDVLDLSGIHTIRREQELERLCKEFLAEELDPTVGPLFAVRLFRLSSQEFILILALDHLIADRASNVIIHNELWTLYQQAAEGSPLRLPELTLQFADYAIWQHQTYAAWRTVHEEYWKGRLSGVRPIKLPQDGAPSQGRDLVHLSSTIPFGIELTAGLVSLARSERTLLPVVVLAVYALAMSHWCKRRDLLIIFVTHARYRAETRDMVGFLANGLRLRVTIEDEDSVSSFLNCIHQELCSAYAHQDFGWSYRFIPEAVTEIGFNWIPPDPLTQRLAIRTRAANLLSVEPFGLTVHWPVPLAIFFYDNKTEVILKMTYRPDVYTSRTIEWFGRDLLLCAAKFVHQPLAPIAVM